MKKTIIISSIFILNSCINPPTPTANLISEPIDNENSSYEYFRVKNLSKELERLDTPKIYLYPALMENQTGLPVISKNFGMMLFSTAQDLAPNIEVYLEESSFNTILENPIKGKRAFKIFGGLTAYNKDYLSISKGFDFGITWGKGRGDSDYDSQFRDTDSISKLSLDLFFMQNGKVYTKSTGTIKIHKINRGYDFGLSINGSGIGANAYTSKSEGVHNSIRRLLHNALFFMIKDVLHKQNLVKNTHPKVIQRDNFSNETPIHKAKKSILENVNNSTENIIDTSSSYSAISYTAGSIDEAENQFLNSLK